MEREIVIAFDALDGDRGLDAENLKRRVTLRVSGLEQGDREFVLSLGDTITLQVPANS